MSFNNYLQNVNPYTAIAAIGLGGATIFGLGGSALVAVGAAIVGNNVPNESLTVLAGGAITGALAGLTSCLIPKTNEDSSTMLRFATDVLKTALCVTAFLTAPLTGEIYLKLNIQWDQTVYDECIGLTTTGAAGATLAVSGGLLKIATERCRTKLFSTAASFFGSRAARPEPEFSPDDKRTPLMAISA